MMTHDLFRQHAAELLAVAKRYHRFQEDPDTFLEHLHDLGDERLHRYRDNISDSMTKREKKSGGHQIRPVVFLRRVIIDRILDGETVTAEDIESIKDGIDASDVSFFEGYPQLHDQIANQKERKTSAFQSWTLFKILHGIDFWFRASNVNKWLTSIEGFIRESLSLEQCKSHLASFDHNQNYGTDNCWVAIYPDYLDRHQDAYQIFFTVHHDRLTYGLVGGSNVPKKGNRKHVPQEGDIDVGDLIDVDMMLRDYRDRLSRFHELNRSLQEEESSETEQSGELATKRSNHALSVVLYGPPGTGKTYVTRRRAVEIIDGPDARRSDEQVAERFKKHRDEGRIEFTTFHPSFAYEEFIEGLRYDTDAEVPTVQDGILKRLARKAMNPYTNPRRSDNARIWKFSLARKSNRTIYNRSLEANEIAIGFIHDHDFTGSSLSDIEDVFRERGKGDKTGSITCMDYFVNEMKDGDYVAIYNDPESIRAVGVVTGSYTYKKDEYDQYPHIRSVKWIDQSVHRIYDLNGSTQMTRQTVYPLDRVALEDFLDLIPDQSASRTPHVLIIDEINRGNLSRIFGELITLLEADKRKGETNELSVRLPYSQERFALPPNLYVIGTMNTADRSIALLDTALRRRFQFEEMMPDVGVIRNELVAALDEASDAESANSDRDGSQTPGDFNLSEEQIDLICHVFETLNQRISSLLDQDHQLGHSYFMGLSSMQDLHLVWYTKVLPLLQEYFYDDASRLQYVVGARTDGDRSGFIVTKSGPSFAGKEKPVGMKQAWQFHKYGVAELEAALRNTFGAPTQST